MQLIRDNNNVEWSKAGTDVSNSEADHSKLNTSAAAAAEPTSSTCDVSVKPMSEAAAAARVQAK